ncbi:MAG: hypothetical protein AB7K24_27575 [Gemmataceae bacterium]
MQHPLQILRDYYLECFAESIENARNRFDQFATELLLELPSLKHPEYCYRLYRADIMGKRAGDPGVLEVNVTAKEVTRWREALPQHVSIVAPVVWNGIEFRVTDANPSEAELVAWTTRWLDLSDSKYVEGQQFQQVAHSVTPPRSAKGGYEFSVDFGSAPTTAFDELLSIISGGSAKVSVGSFTYAGSSSEGGRQRTKHCT